MSVFLLLRVGLVLGGFAFLFSLRKRLAQKQIKLAGTENLQEVKYLIAWLVCTIAWGIVSIFLMVLWFLNNR